MKDPARHGTRSFSLGEIRVAQSARRRTRSNDVQSALQRHSRGDWGVVSPEEWATNDANVVAGHRLLSAYQAASGYRFWVITDYDRRSTTVF